MATFYVVAEVWEIFWLKFFFFTKGVELGFLAQIKEEKIFQLAFLSDILSIVCAFVNYTYSMKDIHSFMVCFEGRYVIFICREKGGVFFVYIWV